MNEIFEFTTIVSSGSAAFDRDCNEYARNGWEPEGDIRIVRDDIPKTFVFIQQWRRPTEYKSAAANLRTLERIIDENPNLRRIIDEILSVTEIGLHLFDAIEDEIQKTKMENGKD